MRDVSDVQIASVGRQSPERALRWYRVCYALIALGAAIQLLIAIPYLPMCARVESTDMVIFYTTSTLLHEGRLRDIYSRELQLARMPATPNANGFFYHLPIELPLIYALAFFQPKTAFFLGDALNLACVLLSAWKVLPRALLPMALVALAFFPVLAILAEGQDAGILFLIYSSAFRLFCEEREGAAGLVLVLSLFKPQYAVIVVAALLILGHRRLAQYFYLGSAVAGLLSVAALGIRGTQMFLDLMRWHGREVASSMVNLRGLVVGLGFPLYSTTLVLSVAAAIYFFMSVTSIQERAARFAAAVALALLISFHAHMYDAALLLIPCSLLMQERRNLWLAVPIACSVVTLFFWFASRAYPFSLLSIAIFFLSCGHVSVDRRKAFACDCTISITH